jgi:hypothetical protein
LKTNAKNYLIYKREQRKLNGIGRGGYGLKIGRYRRCFGRIISLKRDRLEEGLITFDIYTKSLNPS